MSVADAPRGSVEIHAARVSVEFDVPAAMRDGTLLRANIYRPSGNGRRPVLVARTPYGKDLPGAKAWLDPVRAARAGFIVVIQDVRGRFASEGGWQPLRLEGRDGADTVEWAARLPGANGHVGMFGLSYWGATQWLAAIEQPPALGAIAPGMTWSDPRDGSLARGGALELGIGLVWALEQGIDYLRRQRMPTEQISARIEALEQELDGLADRGFWELPASAYLAAARHGVPSLGSVAGLTDPDTAQLSSLAGRPSRVQVPVFSVGGWYDGFAQGVLDNHDAVVSSQPGSRLVVGPWSHANFTDAVGSLSFGICSRRDGGPAGDGTEDVNARQLRFFARHLGHHQESVLADDADPPVRIFLMGTNRWQEFERWPPAGTVEQRWYMRAGGGLTEAQPSGFEPASEFVYDPNSPVPTTGGQLLISHHWAAGPLEQSAIEARSDVLTFSSEPLESPLMVIGRIAVTLSSYSSAPSTDWVARLCDVHPSGQSFNVCDGIHRVASGASESVPRKIDLWSTAHVFAAGHRLRLQVTSSCFPRWDRNLNTGRQDLTTRQAANQHVLHEAGRSSWLSLPILPAIGLGVCG